jgi:hypothetical protein
MIGLGIYADREYRRARGITPPVGNLPANYPEGVAKGFDTSMDLTADELALTEWDYNNIVEHGKSSAMIDAPESIVGRETFDRAYKRWLPSRVCWPPAHKWLVRAAAAGAIAQHDDPALLTAMAPVLVSGKRVIQPEIKK